MTSIGLVLGAGGTVGAAYHAGVLSALAEAGFDARDASIIVGTSAGSGVGALIRGGFPPPDLAARNLGEPLSAPAAAIVGRTGGPPTLELRPRPFSRVPRPASPKLLFNSAGTPAKALAGLLPTGTIANDVIGERIAAVYGDVSWPEKPLWVCAVDLDEGHLVAFGRDETRAPIGVAVQASSAIPAFFRPVVHEGRRYVDGGVHSPTNADLLVGEGLDLVVVISPMSVTTGDRLTSLPSARPLLARRLASEMNKLRASGSEVLAFEPTAADISVMGYNAMDAQRREPTTRQALASARARLADPDFADHLATLRAAGH